jgi:hypothetical protein
MTESNPLRPHCRRSFLNARTGIDRIWWCLAKRSADLGEVTKSARQVAIAAVFDVQLMNCFVPA